MIVEVDTAKCTGHAQCQLAAPDFYVLDDEGYNVTGTTTVPPDQEERVRRGAEACPERAIELS